MGCIKANEYFRNQGTEKVKVKVGCTRVRDRGAQRKGRVLMWMERSMEWDLGGTAVLVDLSGVPPPLLPPARCIGNGFGVGCMRPGVERQE